MGATKWAILFALGAVAAWTVLPLTESKHSVVLSGVAHPDRTPPNPAFFPNYMQNKQGMWLYWRQWSPKVAPKGVVFFVTGLGEHHARYDGIAAEFTKQGFVAYALDNQGQGGSEGDRKFVERFVDYVDDMEQFAKQVTQDAGLAKLPRFVLGHSMGGLIGAHLTLRHPKAFNGVILSAAAMVPDPKTATPFLKKAANVLADLLPKMPLDKLDPKKCSSDAQVIQFIDNDPLMPPQGMTARWANEMLLAMDALWPLAPRATHPLLLLTGSADEVCNAEGSARYHAAVPSTDKALVVYPGMLHEIYREPGFAKVYEDIFAFTGKHMNPVALAWDQSA
jgi:acylglycerol lipase